MRRVPVLVVLVALLVGVSGFLGVRAVRGPLELVVADPPLRFALPAGWHRYDRSGDRSEAYVREAAARQGYTPEEFVAQLEASTLATAVGPVSGGRYQSIDVQKGGFSRLPTPEQVTSEMTRLAMEVDGTRTVSTGAGEVLVAQAHYPVAEGRTDTEVIHLVTRGQGLMITVSSVGGGDVAAVTADVLATLHTS
ncbi:hypothetical protein [Pedococcus sp. P5_B7]